MGCIVCGVAKSWTRVSDVHFHFSLSCTGEGNGTPLQCSCLANPRDGGAWWAAVCGAAQSRGRLKRLSSSSMGTDVSPANCKPCEISRSPRAAQWLLLNQQHRHHLKACKPVVFSPKPRSLVIYMQLNGMRWADWTLWSLLIQLQIIIWYWSRVPCPPSGDLPDPGIKPTSLLSPVLASGFFTTSTIQETHNVIYKWLKDSVRWLILSAFRSLRMEWALLLVSDLENWWKRLWCKGNYWEMALSSRRVRSCRKELAHLWELNTESM